jgi:hypothetical protein
MTFPRWLFFLVAVWVIAFGVFRIVVAVRKLKQPPEPDRPNFRRRGLLALAPRTHILLGVVYLLLGACLIAMGFGWQPASGCLGEPPAEKTGAPAE